MPEMKLIHYPHPLLLKRTRIIQPDEPCLDEKIRTMFEIMYQHKGVGLAGPQAGWDARIFVANPAGQGTEKEWVAINPRIVSSSGRVSEEEGCLSFPGIYVTVIRAKKIEVEYQDRTFTSQRRTLQDFDARVFQHEFDHLENILLVHRMSHTDKVKNRQLLLELEDRIESEGDRASAFDGSERSDR